MPSEITAQALDAEHFVQEKVAEIRNAVGEGTAINALSGGVDSSTVTMLGHRALGKQLKTVFIENGLMRSGEPEQVVGAFARLGVPVEVVDARQEFFAALKGITDPEKKTRGDHPDLLSPCLWAHREGERSQASAPGDDPDRY